MGKIQIADPGAFNLTVLFLIPFLFVCLQIIWHILCKCTFVSLYSLSFPTNLEVEYIVEFSCYLRISSLFCFLLLKLRYPCRLTYFHLSTPINYRLLPTNIISKNTPKETTSEVRVRDPTVIEDGRDLSPVLSFEMFKYSTKIRLSPFRFSK